MATVLGVLAGMVASLLFCVVAALAVAGVGTGGMRSAVAGASAPAAAPRGLDLDGDGRVSLAEAAGHADVVTKFARADRNRDGRLDPKEMERLKSLEAKPPAVGKTARKTARKTAASTAGSSSPSRSAP